MKFKMFMIGHFEFLKMVLEFHLGSKVYFQITFLQGQLTKKLELRFSGSSSTESSAPSPSVNQQMMMRYPRLTKNLNKKKVTIELEHNLNIVQILHLLKSERGNKIGFLLLCVRCILNFL